MTALKSSFRFILRRLRARVIVESWHEDGFLGTESLCDDVVTPSSNIAELFAGWRVGFLDETSSANMDGCLEGDAIFTGFTAMIFMSSRIEKISIFGYRWSKN